MEYVFVGSVVLVGAILTFISGFGLGTLMLPVFSLFFPLPVAIGATAMVHLANNLFKFGLVYRHIHFSTLMRFGFPALFAAILGGYALSWLGESNAFYSYVLVDKIYELTYLKTVIGFLMLFFALFDLIPALSSWKVDKKYLPLGGLLSGFFGGISGHQGAFRSAFLVKAGLTKEQFVGTGNAIALIIDIARLVVYKKAIDFTAITEAQTLLLVAIICAFAGTYFGKKFIHKTTLRGIQYVVGVLLSVLGILFIAGLL